MTSNYRTSNGTDLDDIFEPRSSSPVGNTGFRDASGNDLAQRYEKLSSGSSAGQTGYRLSNGSDLNTVFAAKGSVSYALPVNGRSYSATTTRGSATVGITIGADGTYRVTRGGQSVDSGTWLPPGEFASNWAVQFDVAQQGTTAGGGANTTTNDAPSAAPCSSDHSASASSQATTATSSASSTGSITIRLYRGGTLRSTTTISFSTSVSGS